MVDANPEQFRLKVDWDFGTVPSRYATNLLVQTGESEFFIGFFEIRPPILFEQDGPIPTATPIKAECVARVIVPIGKMQDFINVMQQSLNQATEQLNRQAQEEHSVPDSE